MRYRTLTIQGTFMVPEPANPEDIQTIISNGLVELGSTGIKVEVRDLPWPSTYGRNWTELPTHIAGVVHGLDGFAGRLVARDNCGRGLVKTVRGQVVIVNEDFFVRSNEDKKKEEQETKTENTKTQKPPSKPRGILAALDDWA